jgi:putative NADPH-quinone reductase
LVTPLIRRFATLFRASGKRALQKETFVRVLVLFAHPVETSFNAALHDKLVATLRSRGHQVDDCDLNAEGFDPVLSRQDRIDYHTVGVNRARVAPYVDRLLAAEALALSFPVWNMGFPAILKGFLDRVLLPGVSFDLTDDGVYTPHLHNIKRLGAVCTYGGTRLLAISVGDPPRRVVKRVLRSVIAPGSPCDYLAHYDMNHTKPERRAAFLDKVAATFAYW